MNVKKLIKEDDAVSPVIGVILMVAITVILAAVIASFVLGLGDQAQQTTPQASFSFDYTQSSGTGDSLQITHDGGDTIEASNLDAATSGVVDGSGNDLIYDSDLFGTSGDVQAGTTATIDASGSGDFASTAGGAATAADMDGGTIRVVYNSPSGDSSSTLATWEGPDA